LQNGTCRFVKKHDPTVEAFYWHFNEVRPLTSIVSSRI
jgi:hypothetical protein